MKKLLLTMLMFQMTAFAAQSNTPNSKNLLIDQEDGTDVFAIPLDESDEDDNLQLEQMEAQQADYFKKNPEAYKKWLETHPQKK